MSFSRPRLGSPPAASDSPVTNLAHDLSTTSIGSNSTPRRRLSLSSSSEEDDIVPACKSELRGIRLLQEVSLNDTPDRRSRLAIRRVQSLPFHLRFSSLQSPSAVDKENVPAVGQARSALEGHPLALASPKKSVLRTQFQRSPLKELHGSGRGGVEELDVNSQDSGYAGSERDFRFVEPQAPPPRRLKPCPSPPPFYLSSPPPRSVHHPSSSSPSSADDDFPDDLLSDLDEETQMPSTFGDLISAPITAPSALSFTNVLTKPSFRRCLSMDQALAPLSSRVERPSDSSSRLPSPSVSLSFKRPPEPLSELSSTPQQPTKRRRSVQSGFEGGCVLNPIIPPTHSNPELRRSESDTTPVIKKKTTKLQRCFSESEATIKRALQKASQQPDLIGDFSRPYLLAQVEGKHADLKSVNCDTVAAVVRGEGSQYIRDVVIVDCRYPYEFAGGHIKGAKNIYTKDDILAEFLRDREAKTPPAPSSPEEEGSTRNIGIDEQMASPSVLTGHANPQEKRDVLIFHCEFSSERGPNLCRFLRRQDREMNKTTYPALHYPEMYVLHGGYKAFFQAYPELCEPRSYRPMLDPDHESDLRHFRTKSKSWAGDGRGRPSGRSSLKRLGL